MYDFLLSSNSLRLDRSVGKSCPRVGIRLISNSRTIAKIKHKEVPCLSRLCPFEVSNYPLLVVIKAAFAVSITPQADRLSSDQNILGEHLSSISNDLETLPPSRGYQVSHGNLYPYLAL